MERLLGALLGFFFTVTILLIFLENCAFSAGCGGRYRMREGFSDGCPYTEPEGFANPAAGCGSCGMGDDY